MSKKINFKFEELEYQEKAVNAVVDLLDGIDRRSISSIYTNQSAIRSLDTTHPEANARFSVGTRLIQNMQSVQYRNNLFKDSGIIGRIPQFSVEMETGTGKTFVYLKTILSLWQTYGEQFKKFIIVVPSNPILLGVKKSIEMLSDYFKPTFKNIDLSEHCFVYDKNCTVETVSGRLVESTDLSVMLITYQSFNKDSNRLRTRKENGVMVWEDIKDIAPIVIIDEPQKVDGTGRKKTKTMEALEELNPIMILRYSATHKNLYNQVYKLDSYDAYKERLVKGIKVTTIHSLTDKDFPYVRFIGVTPELKARIEIFCNNQGNSTRCTKFDVEINAALEELSGGLPQYKNWYVSEQPNKLKPLAISRNDGTILTLNKGQSNDEIDPEISVEKQMKIAIKAHINKQIEILNSGNKIKALALFFVDSVAKVRGDAPDGRGEYLMMFDRLFDNIRQEMMLNLNVQSVYNRFPNELAILNPDIPVSAVREGYFAVDKHKKAVEIEKWDSSKNDEDISFDAKTQENIDRGIDLILNKKDELITFGEPLTFIFSHSALREGWDNPNVFTLVTLKQGGSDIAKKQEVGRGLRLPVNVDGVRCKIDDINELTVIANDYYDQFAEALQDDYNKSMGFDKNEVTADIIKQTVINAGIPNDKIEAACDAFKRELVTTDFVKVDRSGKIILKKEAENIQSIIFSEPTLIEYSSKIIDVFSQLMSDRGSRRIPIANGDEDPVKNDFQKYYSEEDFNRMYRTMLKILQKRSIYRYKFDKEKFITEISADLNRILARKSDKVKFEITNANVEFSDAGYMQMAGVESEVDEAESKEIKYEYRSTFELANYIMYQTMLPRLAIIRIIDNLNDTSRNRINNQDYLEDAVKLINDKLVEYKSQEFLTAELVEGIGAEEKQIFEIDKIVNETDIRYLFTPNPAHRKALNLKYKFDSEGEMTFADKIDKDPNVLMWTKLKKGGFILETPAGNYSPDWAIVYQKNNDKFCMYFIAETKWNKEWGSLMNDEKIKIKCAGKHFEAVNNELPEIIKFNWVNSYNDNLKDNSFPQIFTDEIYSSTTSIERFSS